MVNHNVRESVAWFSESLLKRKYFSYIKLSNTDDTYKKKNSVLT